MIEIERERSSAWIPSTVFVPSIFVVTVAGIVFGPVHKETEVVAGHEDRAGHVGRLVEVAQRDRAARCHRVGVSVPVMVTPIWLLFAVTLFAQALVNVTALAELAGKTKTAGCGHGEHGER